MARRALTFGVRLRDPDRGETLRIRAAERASDGYVVEHEGRGAGTRRRRHARLSDAVRDGARIWRHRLN
jgi:hypothetical protein